MTRQFSGGQKAVLLVVAGGKCERCGCELQPGWHADHVEPYSAGGPTTLANGAALCPACNLAKGASDLREWQRIALDKYQAVPNRDFLCVACPGAGKTTFALSVASWLLRAGAVTRVIVVVPTRHLVRQWTEAAPKFKIQLQEGMEETHTIGPDFIGAAVTYQYVCANPGVLQMHSTRAKTLVILDEVHHCGEKMHWGDQCISAFGGAERRLLLSGTPDRTGNDPIPFVRYEDNHLQWDYEYGYGDALRDGVCRTVAFPRFDSTVEWQIVKNSGEMEYTASFSEQLTRENQADRLRAALKPHGEFLSTLLSEADEQLAACRERGDPKAGGLVIAMDVNHAREIHRMLGADSVIAVSEDPDSGAVIERYKASRTRWLVAVKMVSEGVDIPRLRVLVYATNYTARTYFRQTVGRIVRIRQDLDEQTAYVYIPDDPRLVELAEEIKEIRAHALRDMEKGVGGGGGGGRDPEQIRMMIGANSTPAELSAVTYDGGNIEAYEYAVARDAVEKFNFTGGSIPAVALMFREWAQGAPVPILPPAPQPKPVNLNSKRDRLRAEIVQGVNKIARLTGENHQSLHATVNDSAGCRARKHASIDQLEIMSRYVASRLAALDG